MQGDLAMVELLLSLGLLEMTHVKNYDQPMDNTLNETKLKEYVWKAANLVHYKSVAGS